VIYLAGFFCSGLSFLALRGSGGVFSIRLRWPVRNDLEGQIDGETGAILLGLDINLRPFFLYLVHADANIPVFLPVAPQFFEPIAKLRPRMLVMRIGDACR